MIEKVIMNKLNNTNETKQQYNNIEMKRKCFCVPLNRYLTKAIPKI